MKPLEHFPASSVELLNEIDMRNPTECIKPNETETEAHRRAGRRELIDELIVLRNRQG